VADRSSRARLMSGDAPRAKTRQRGYRLGRVRLRRSRARGQKTISVKTTLMVEFLFKRATVTAAVVFHILDDLSSPKDRPR